MRAACAHARGKRSLACVHKQLARSHKMRAALSSRCFGWLHMQRRRTCQYGRSSKMAGVTSAKDFALITKLLAVIRMTEQAREMTVDLKKIIAAQREPRARNLFE